MPLLNMHVHFFPHSEFSVPENPHFQFITILIDFQQKALIYDMYPESWTHIYELG